jgi:phage N-6-adenine-methyltransferase
MIRPPEPYTEADAQAQEAARWNEGQEEPMPNSLQTVTKSAIEKKTDIKELAKLKSAADAAEIFYKAQDDLQASQKAKEISFRSARRAGWLLLPENTPRENGGRPKNSFPEKRVSTPYQEALDGTGITPFISATWQKLAKTPEGLFEKYLADAKFANTEFTIKGLLRYCNNIHVSDGTYEWYTPEEYISLAVEVLGKIDLDPASSKQANEVVGAGEFFTEDDDGLSHDWRGNVWLNPPYSMPHVLWFVKKAIKEYDEGRVTSAIILVNNATDTGWFHLLAERFPFCITRGRVPFWGGDGQMLGPRQGQVLFYLGKDAGKFKASFSRVGLVVVKL